MGVGDIARHLRCHQVSERTYYNKQSRLLNKKKNVLENLPISIDLTRRGTTSSSPSDSIRKNLKTKKKVG